MYMCMLICTTVQDCQASSSWLALACLMTNLRNQSAVKMVEWSIVYRGIML